MNIQRFLNRNECFELREGLRTGIIRPAGKKEQSVTISGFHPNPKDQTVVNYLLVQGKVSSSGRIIHLVFPGPPGSSLCAGNFNGTRNYMVKIYGVLAKPLSGNVPQTECYCQLRLASKSLNKLGLSCAKLSTA